MAKDAVLQVRIDAQLKSDVEQLYRDMGTSFSEAVRLFARQSLIRRRLPFDVAETEAGADGREAGVRALERAAMPAGADSEEASSRDGDSGFAMFAAYASDRLRAQEKGAWQAAVAEKHGGPHSAQGANACGAGKVGQAR